MNTVDQIRVIEVPLTPQQQMAFTFHGFPEPTVQIIGRDFHAFTVKPSPITGNRFEWAEFMARSPEIAVEQLTRLVARA